MFKEFFNKIWRKLIEGLKKAGQAEFEHQKWRSQYIKKHGIDPCPDYNTTDHFF